MNSSETPEISIITVCLNAEKELQLTLESVLNQRFRSYEIIVIDGGSTDNTQEVLSRYNDKIDYMVSEKDQGIYDAMNKGLKRSSGKYIIFLNAGDRFYDDEVLGVMLKDSPEGKFDVIYGDVEIVDESIDKSWIQKAKPFTFKSLVTYGTGTLCHQAFIVRKEIAPEYNSALKYKAELQWYFDILKDNRDVKTQRIKRPVVKYAIGGKGYQNFWENLKENHKVVKEEVGWINMIRYGYLYQVLGKLKYRFPVRLKKL